MLTQSQRVEFCKRCLHKSFDLKKGVTCGLTQEKPAFESSCSDFSQNPQFKEEANDEHLDLTSKELQSQVPPGEYLRLLEEQNWTRALCAGGAVALTGAALWVTIAVLTGYIFAVVAMGIGLAVSLTVRATGKGIEQKFKVLSVVLTLASCIIGGFFAVIAYIAQIYEANILDVLLGMEPLELKL